MALGDGKANGDGDGLGRRLRLRFFLPRAADSGGDPGRERPCGSGEGTARLLCRGGREDGDDVLGCRLFAYRDEEERKGGEQQDDAVEKTLDEIAEHLGRRLAAFVAVTKFAGGGGRDACGRNR